MKPWQVFGLVVVVPFGIQFALMSSFMSGDKPDVEAMFSIFPIIMVAFMAIFISWFWGIGTGLNKLVQKEIRPSSNLFRFGIIYTACYALIFTFIFFQLVGKREPGGEMALIIPFHFLAMFCMFYALYFIAKNLVMAEKNQVVTFGDFAGPFFLIWFYPIGIWFIQPRINRLCAQ